MSACLDLPQRLLFLSVSEGETLGFGHSLLVHRGVGTSIGTLCVFLSKGSPVPSENHLIFPFVFPPGRSLFIAGDFVVGFHSSVFLPIFLSRQEKMSWSNSVEISEPVTQCGVGSPYLCV